MTERRQAMNEQQAAEPTLEEILASIRRIISEEGPGAVSSFPAMRPLDPEEADDVLVLTRRAPPIELQMTASQSQRPKPRSNGDTAMEPSQAPAVEEAASAAPAAQDVIVAPTTAASTSAAFERLSQAAALREAPRPQILMPEPGRTLEDVVRDLMRPLIKEWLDENLAEIVERRVEEEIERIVKHRVR
jgi:cell pole-organizing protein PopZ